MSHQGKPDIVPIYSASKLFNPAIGFLLTLAFGFWLSRKGKPYNGLLFNLHKLIALGTVILTAMAVYQALKVIDTSATIILLLIIAALSGIALFASGALMSAGKGEYRVMKLIHNVSPVALILAMLATVYLLGG